MMPTMRNIELLEAHALHDLDDENEMKAVINDVCAAARRGVEADAEIAQIRDALTGDDYASLPSDLPTVRMAHTIRADHDKFRNQVRDTCQRAERLETELAALKVERDELRAAAASLSADVSALGGELEALKAAQPQGAITYPKRERLPDDERKALDAMVSAMSEKLYSKYLEGYCGFEGASEDHINRLLHEHLPKGDPVDVANFCAFLLHNGQRVRTLPERVSVPREPSNDYYDAIWQDFCKWCPEHLRPRLSIMHIRELVRSCHRAMLAAAQEGK